MSELSNMKQSLSTFRKISDLYNLGIVVPYEDYLIQYLATHTDKVNLPDTNFLDSLNSVESIGNCYRYTRYLALGLTEPFILIEGNLSSLYGGHFPHCWIETKDYVYDVGFAGKWPKSTYYNIFKPKQRKEMPLRKDPYLYQLRMGLTASKEESKDKHLKYIGWHGYTACVSQGNSVEKPVFHYFPEDKEKMDKKPVEQGHIETEIPIDKTEPMGYTIDPELNICITKYGAYMCNTPLYVDCTKEEIEEYLQGQMWQEYIKHGYKLVVKPAFNYPEFMAIYLENWQEIKEQRGTIPGTLTATYVYEKPDDRGGSILL